MMFVTDKELIRSRKIVLRILEREFRGWSHLLGQDRTEFRLWAMSTASEAIGLGLAEKAKYDPLRGSVTTWFLMKARRLAQRDIRKAENDLRLIHVLEQEPPPPETEDPFADYLLSDELSEVLQELTQLQLQALGLIYMVGLSYEEAAAFLKKDRNAVDALVHRAKAKAREVYRRKFPTHYRHPPKPSPTPKNLKPKARPRSSLGGSDDEDSDGEMLETGSLI